MGRTNDIIKLCDFKKAGRLNDTFIIETDKNRIIYFTAETDVMLDCPGKQINTRLNGLHNVSLACDITTSQAHWPAKQTATINIQTETPNTFIPGELPIASIDKNSDTHESLKKLISELPGEDEPWTIDFESYDIDYKQLHTYTIFSQSVLTTIVIINSILIGIILFKTKKNKDHLNDSPPHRTSSIGRSLRRIRDSIRTRKNKFNRDSWRRSLNHWRDSMRTKGSSIKGKLRDLVTPTQIEHHDKGVGTEEHRATIQLTEVEQTPPTYVPRVYPPLARYD